MTMDSITPFLPATSPRVVFVQIHPLLLRSGAWGVALQACTSKYRTKPAPAGNLKESQRPEHCFSYVCRIHPPRKKSSYSMLHFRKSYPNSQHSLKSQHTDPENICLTSCLLRLACQARHSTEPTPSRSKQGRNGELMVLLWGNRSWATGGNLMEMAGKAPHFS